MRCLIRESERLHEAPGLTNTDYFRLHEYARHAIHISETLDLANETIESMMAHQNQLAAERRVDTDGGAASRQARMQMQFFQSMLKSLRCRSQSNHERMKNEIQLAFNTVAQFDSKVAVDIGRAAQQDSSAMKTVAFLTLAFFPATYICALFSMSYFSLDDTSGRWHVSDKFWLYWVVTVPVTCLSVSSWWIWQKFFPPKLVGEVQTTQIGSGPEKTDGRELNFSRA